MQNDNDLIRRNRELKAQATREVAADAAGYRAAVDHARERMRKLIRARALWPRFLRRIYPAGARAP